MPKKFETLNKVAEVQSPPPHVVPQITSALIAAIPTQNRTFVTVTNKKQYRFSTARNVAMLNKCLQEKKEAILATERPYPWNVFEDFFVILGEFNCWGSDKKLNVSDLDQIIESVGYTLELFKNTDYVNDSKLYAFVSAARTKFIEGLLTKQNAYYQQAKFLVSELEGPLSSRKPSNLPQEINNNNNNNNSKKRKFSEDDQIPSGNKKQKIDGLYKMSISYLIHPTDEIHQNDSKCDVGQTHPLVPTQAPVQTRSVAPTQAPAHSSPYISNSVFTSVQPNDSFRLKKLELEKKKPELVFTEWERPPSP